MSERLNRSYDFNTKEDEHQSMVMQLTRVIDYLDYLPLTTITIENIEADDTMAYLTKQVMKTSKIVLMSTDKDFLQLVNHRVSVWSPTKDYGIPSHNFAVYRAIDGDKSDNIDGVRGWGLKTIQKKLPFLLEDKILNIADIINEDEKLKESEELLKRNYMLMQLDEVDISASAKTKILDKVREPINRLNKIQFQKRFIEDRLFATLPNMDSWLVQCFAKLNQMAEKTHGKKT
jgi:DNA polymerase-1